jgi:cell division protease FtsH
MIFIDEIDAIGYKRKNLSNPLSNGLVSSNREAETTLNQLLNEMDGFESNQNILVVSATNLIGNIDDALIRPGRFDHKIEIKLPNALERAQILKIHLQNKKHKLS